MALKKVFSILLKETSMITRCTAVELSQRSISGDGTLKKRPLTGFMRFLKLQRKISELDEGVRASDFVTLVGQKWRNLPEQDKDVHIRAAREELTQFNESLTKEDREALKERRANNKAKRELKVKRNDNKAKAQVLKQEYDKPIRPVTAFFLFMRTLNRGNTGAVDFAAEAGRQYKELSEPERKAYEEQYLKARATYNKKHVAWINKMFKTGNADLLDKNEVLKYLEKPVRPRGAPYLYAEESLRLTEVPEDQVWKATIDLRKQFHAINKEEQKKYVVMFQQQLDAYKEKEAVWLQTLEKHGVLHMFLDDSPKPRVKKEKTVVDQTTAEM